MLERRTFLQGLAALPVAPVSVAAAGEPDAVLLSRGGALDAVLTPDRKAGLAMDGGAT